MRDTEPTKRWVASAEAVSQIPAGSAWGTVARVTQSRIEIVGLGRHLVLGGRVTICTRDGGLAKAELVSLHDDLCIASIVGVHSPIRVGDRAMASLPAKAMFISVEDAWLGRIVGPEGQPLDGLGPLPVGAATRAINAGPAVATDRIMLGDQVQTGVKAIDLFIPIRHGQRLGVFAGTGVGKSTLVTMIASAPGFDVVVFALIGERSREVNELVREMKSAGLSKNSVWVVATSDMSSLEKRDSARVALTICEKFRDDGKRVLLIFDSVSRYCDALRDIALTADELPSLQGYPPSVFMDLAKLLERAGPGLNTAKTPGYITAFFTVLLGAEGDVSLVADAVRGVLDGHIFLSRQLAERGQYPAVDIMRSISRCGTGLFSRYEEEVIRDGRAALALYETYYDSVALGVYKWGTNPQLDASFISGKEIQNYMLQNKGDFSTTTDKINELSKIIAK